MAWEEYWFTLAPRWLRDGYADGFHTAVAGLIDVMVDGAKEAAKLGLVTEAGAEGVRELARERGIEPYDGETVEALRLRVADAWNHWGESGTRAGLLERLEDYTTDPLHLLDVVTDGAHLEFDSVPNADAWSRLWVTVDGGVYAPPTVGPGLVVGPSVLVGIDMSLSQLRRYRRIFRRYKPAHVIGCGIWVDVSGAVVDMTDPSAIVAAHAAGDVVYLPLHVDTVGPRARVGPGLVVGTVYA